MADDSNSSAEKWSAKLPAISAALTAFTLAASVIHDVGYFIEVGFQWITLQTVGDYISNAIMWLPASIITAVAGMLVGALLTFRASKGSTTEPQPAKSRSGM